MWNQGNGQGQGSGYDVYGRLNNTKEIGAKFPYLEGSGKYALCTLEEFQHNTDGPSARALFEVLESKDGKHQVGSYVAKIWKLVKPGKYPNSPTDADMFADFCRKLKNAPPGFPIGDSIRTLMKERVTEQLARGTVIEAVAVPKDYVKRDGSKAVWVNVYWNAIPQTPEQIVALRQRMEAKGIPDTGHGSAQQAAQYVQQPMPPQGARVPLSPQAQQFVNQFAPQQAQPQWQPQQGQPGMTQTTPAPAPQGGFLAQIPQAGQGGQGNQGGGQGGW